MEALQFYYEVLLGVPALLIESVMTVSGFLSLMGFIAGFVGLELARQHREWNVNMSWLRVQVESEGLIL